MEHLIVCLNVIEKVVSMMYTLKHHPTPTSYTLSQNWVM